MTAVTEKRPTQRRTKATEAPVLDLSFSQAHPIVTRQWTKLHMVLVGCGGTGSWIAPSVARLAAVLIEVGRNVTVTFFDGDHIEPKNIPRQNFCAAELGLNKAQALAFRYSTAWGVPIRSVPKHYGGAGVVPAPKEGELLVLIGCVDNAKARQSLAATLTHYNKTATQPPTVYTPQTWWLDCGNSAESGQVLLGSTSEEKDLQGAFKNGLCTALPSPTWHRPELLKAQPDELVDPSKRLSCAELALLNAQSLMINQGVAAVAADYLYRLVMAGGLKKWATVLDQESGVHKSYYTTPEGVAAAIGKPMAVFDVKRSKVQKNSLT